MMNDLWLFDLQTVKWRLLSRGTGPAGGTFDRGVRRLSMDREVANPAETAAQGAPPAATMVKERLRAVNDNNASAGAGNGTVVQGTAPPPVEGAGFVASGGKLYVFGGRSPYLYLAGTKYAKADVNYLHALDLETLSWENLTNSSNEGPFKRHGMGLAMCDSRLYVFGGSEIDPFNDLIVYDPPTREWSVLAPGEELNGSPLSARSFMNVAAVGGSLYFYGGRFDDDSGGFSDSNDFYRFDVDLLRWTPLGGENSSVEAPETPTVDYFSMAATDRAVYLLTNGADTRLSALYRFDHFNQSWSTITASSGGGAAPPGRSSFGMAALRITAGEQTSDGEEGGEQGWRLYIFGGHGFGALGRSMKDMYAFDVAGRAWELIIAVGDLPTVRYNHGFASAGGRLFTFGGHTCPACVTNDLRIFDPVNKSWTKLGSNLVKGEPPAPRALHGFTESSGRLFVFGGISGQLFDPKRMNDLFQFDPVRLEWTELGSSIVLESPPTVRFGLGLAATRGALYVFGGVSDEGPLGDLMRLDVPKVVAWKSNAVGALLLDTYDWDHLVIPAVAADGTRGGGPSNEAVLAFRLSVCVGLFPCALTVRGAGGAGGTAKAGVLRIRMTAATGGTFVCLGIVGCTSLSLQSVIFVCDDRNSADTAVAGLAKASAIVVGGAALSVERCAFVGCAAVADGACIHSYNGADVQIQDSDFRDSHSGGRGGAISAVGSSLRVDASRFNNCSAVVGGGAVAAAATQCYDQAGQEFQTHVEITAGTFLSCSSAGPGGAILVMFDTATVSVADSFFTGCVSGSVGGAVSVSESAHVRLTNCLLANNSAAGFGGGALHARAAALTLHGVTCTGNSASSGGGGAMYWQGCAVSNAIDSSDCRAVAPVVIPWCGAGTFPDPDFECLPGRCIGKCISCPAGKYRSNVGAVDESACASCLAGKYSSAISSTNNCTPCGPGLYTTATGATGPESCIGCAAGTFSWRDVSSGCEDCPAGQFVEANASACEFCQSGTYSTVVGGTGQEICTTCPAGSYADAEAATECVLCDAGTFSNATAATECTECKPGTNSAAGATACKDCSSPEPFFCDLDSEALSWRPPPTLSQRNSKQSLQRPADTSLGLLDGTLEVRRGFRLEVPDSQVSSFLADVATLPRVSASVPIIVSGPAAAAVSAAVEIQGGQHSLCGAGNTALFGSCLASSGRSLELFGLPVESAPAQPGLSFGVTVRKVDAYNQTITSDQVTVVQLKIASTDGSVATATVTGQTLAMLSAGMVRAAVAVTAAFDVVNAALGVANTKGVVYLRAACIDFEVGLRLESSASRVLLAQNHSVCPTGYVITVGTDGLGTCMLCQSGTYSVDPLQAPATGVVPACLACPAAGLCEGGAQVHFATGNWTIENGVYRLVACPPGNQLVDSLAGAGGAFAQEAQRCVPCGDTDYILSSNNSQVACQPCPAGARCDGTSFTSLVAGAVWLPELSTSRYILASCPGGYELLNTASGGFSYLSQQCSLCPALYFCQGGTTARRACPPDTFAPAGSNASSSCAASTFVTLTLILPMKASEVDSVKQLGLRQAIAYSTDVRISQVVVTTIVDQRRASPAKSAVSATIATADRDSAERLSSSVSEARLNIQLLNQGLPAGTLESVRVQVVSTTDAVSPWPAIGAVIGTSILFVAGVVAVVFYLRRTEDSEEDRLLRRTMAELRIRFRMRQEDGFLLHTEQPPSFIARMLRRLQRRLARQGSDHFGRGGLAEYTVFKRSYLEAATRLELHQEFDLPQFDALCLCLECADDGRAEPGSAYHAVCDWLLDISQQLIRPSLPSISSVSATSAEDGTTTEKECRLRVEDRFPYFLDRVIRARVWADCNGELFERLRLSAALYMDQIAALCDARSEKMRTEPRGVALFKFYPSPDESKGLVQILRQDHPEVRAVTVSEDAKKEAQLAQGLCRLPNFSEGFGEEIFVSQLHRRAILLNEAFQERIATVVCEHAMPSSVDEEPSTVYGDLEVDHVDNDGIQAAVTRPTTTEPRVAAAELCLARPSAEPARLLFERGASSGNSSVRQSKGHRISVKRIKDWGDNIFSTTSSGFFPWRAPSAMDSISVYEGGGGHTAATSRHSHQLLKVQCFFQEGPGEVAISTAPPKGTARMREKLAEYAADGCAWPLTSCILDPVRSAIVCSGPAQILEVASWFLGQSVPAETTGGRMIACKIKNKFALPKEDLVGGYRDLMICVIFYGPQGLRIIGEIQIHDRTLYELKLLMHKLYRIQRAKAATAI